MDILLSIHPNFIAQIKLGLKKFEYRKMLPKMKVQTIYIYGTRPISKVIAKFKVQQVISDNLVSLWEKTKYNSGITEEEFFQYFSKCDTAYAIEIANFELLPEPLELEEFCGKKHPPQNFYYLK
ncbi:TPA: ASCH domain-containing protein [Neisseria subflava]|nr:ASCH domain-containing protein [uncultured Neisseria sp.]